MAVSLDRHAFEGQTMSFVVHDGFALVLHRKDNPSEEEWAKFLAVAAKLGRPAGRFPTLVFTDGGAPGKGQRDALWSVYRGLEAPVLVVTASAIARFVISSLALFGIKIKSASPERWREALAEMRLSPAERLAADELLRELRNTSFGTNVEVWAQARQLAPTGT